MDKAVGRAIENLFNKACLISKDCYCQAISMKPIQPEREIKKIAAFLKQKLAEQKFKKVVVGISGGLDSATVLFLLTRTVAPSNIFVLHIPYFKSNNDAKSVATGAGIPAKNFHTISIAAIVKTFAQALTAKDNTRLGNIMARARMIVLYDFAKAQNCLVVGTENKSEYMLGYFTRFGDQASDIEPIQHLYKTQVYQLAEYLGVPKEILDKKPTADLWQGQTDESEFGFSYKEADQVLYFYTQEKLSVAQIKKKGFTNAEKIIAYSHKNLFKHQTPFTLEQET